MLFKTTTSISWAELGQAQLKQKEGLFKEGLKYYKKGLSQN